MRPLTYARSPSLGTPRRRLPALLALLLISLLATGNVSAGEPVETRAEVRNALPELLVWNATVDERAGLFVYHVEAKDANGVEDLDRIVFHFISEADGDLRGMHVDEDVHLHERHKVSWDGTAQSPDSDGLVYRVELHVIDAAGDRVIHSRPYTTLDQARDAAEEATGESLPDERDAIAEAKRPLPRSPLGPLTLDTEVLRAWPTWATAVALAATLAVSVLVPTLAMGLQARASDVVRPAVRVQARRLGAARDDAGGRPLERARAGPDEPGRR